MKNIPFIVGTKIGSAISDLFSTGFFERPFFQWSFWVLTLIPQPVR